MRFIRVMAALLSVSLVLGTACKKKKSDSTSSGDDEEKESLAIDNEFAKAMPADLAVSSPYAQASEDDIKDVNSLETELADDEDSKSYQARRLKTLELLNGDSAEACAYEIPAVPTITNPDCYGPSIAYQNHTDGGGGNGTLPSGDLGIWSATEAGGEACVAAKMNAEIERAGAMTDIAVKTLAMIFCAAKQNEDKFTMPTKEGKSEDVLAIIEDTLGGQDIGGTFESASIEVEDVVDEDKGLYQYLSTFSFEANNTVFNVSIRHRMLDEDNTTYRGKMWLSADGSFGNMCQGQTCDHALVSVAYDKVSEDETRIDYRYKPTADDTEANWFTDDKDVSTDGNSGYYWGLSALDPETGAGKIAFAWAAGMASENVRSFIAEVSGDLGERSGCGYYGYGVELSTLKDDPSTGWLDRMICNWAGPGNSRTGATLVQKQCMEENEDGLLVPTTSNISYVPRTTCGVGEGPNTSFQWRLFNSTGAYTAFSANHDLVDISDLTSGTLDIPDRPEALD